MYSFSFLILVVCDFPSLVILARDGVNFISLSSSQHLALLVFLVCIFVFQFIDVRS